MEKMFYDDYAINPSLFEIMAKEYKNQENNISSLKINKSQNIKNNQNETDIFFGEKDLNENNQIKENSFQNQHNIETKQENKINIENISKLFNEINKLQNSIQNLLSLTSNQDIIVVLNDILSEIEIENQNLLNTFAKRLNKNMVAKMQNIDDIERQKMFCNSLKSAINITGGIVKLLVNIKNDDVLFEYSILLTHSINLFLDINSKLVSLFGDCRYRVFGIFRNK